MYLLTQLPIPVFQEEGDGWSDEEKHKLVDRLASVCDDTRCTDETCIFVSDSCFLSMSLLISVTLRPEDAVASLLLGEGGFHSTYFHRVP